MLATSHLFQRILMKVVTKAKLRETDSTKRRASDQSLKKKRKSMTVTSVGTETPKASTKVKEIIMIEKTREKTTSSSSREVVNKTCAISSTMMSSNLNAKR